MYVPILSGDPQLKSPRGEKGRERERKEEEKREGTRVGRKKRQHVMWLLFNLYWTCLQRMPALLWEKVKCSLQICNDSNGLKLDAFCEELCLHALSKANLLIQNPHKYQRHQLIFDVFH